MWELFTDPSNLIFSISLCLMFLLGLLECLMLLVGSTTQGFLDQFVPDSLFEADHPDVELNPDQSFVVQLLDWLYIGRIPVLVWLIIFLTVYALFGFICQAIFHHFTQSYLTLWITAPATLFLCMPLVRLCSAVIAKILPKDETTAIYSDELIGLTAEIILGEAKLNYPAQAKVKDHFGQIHYILVEPESNLIFQPGQFVVLTQRTNNGFQAIPT
ncbi:YqiJ family protein [Acinetobacter sp. 194]|uniref:YqiJ family protein n=1 Tax=Acinetobacter shaoyimingii TaxID=2715164 RepID=UPI00140E1597|nr:YqiJ family protein [Acinetobacter shaoyimingii]NHB57714.1 YqiJ family protein [Acinetobacter shaoyimingii]